MNKSLSFLILKSDDGFTLLELLIVMAILGLLGVVGTIQLSGYLGRAKVDTAKLQVDQLSAAINLYRLDVGRVPTTEEGIASLITSPDPSPGWRGPYLEKSKALNDPWGRPFLYKNPGDHGEYDLISLGADGKPGGTGQNVDITNWQN